MSEKNMKNCYIGEIYAKDVYDYCDMSFYYHNDDIPLSEGKKDLISKLRKVSEGGIVFYGPAALFGSLWLVYRGMIKRAIIMDAVRIVLFELIFSSLVSGVGGIVFILIYSFKAIPWYYNHIYDAIKKRGLLMRSPVESEELESNLWWEGRPSLKRAFIYMLFRALVILICNDIIHSMVLYNLGA